MVFKRVCLRLPVAKCFDIEIVALSQPKTQVPSAVDDACPQQPVCVEALRCQRFSIVVPIARTNLTACIAEADKMARARDGNMWAYRHS